MGSIYDRLAINLGAVAGSNGRSEESPPISVGWGREGVTGGGGRGRVGGGDGGHAQPGTVLQGVCNASLTATSWQKWQRRPSRDRKDNGRWAPSNAIGAPFNRVKSEGGREFPAASRVCLVSSPAPTSSTHRGMVRDGVFIGRRLLGSGGLLRVMILEASSY